MEKSSPTVFIIDDDAATREWVGGLAESIGLNVEAFTSAPEFIARYEQDKPGCLVLDVRLPHVSGLELQSLLHERHIDLPVIMMSAFAEVGVAVEAMKAGAVDFIEKPCSGQGLLDRINKAIALDRSNCDRRRAGLVAHDCLATLTGRERDVLEGILSGKANKVIAIDLAISEKTVEARRAVLMHKMKATSVSELVQLALLAKH